jgi:hypothetical protein
MPRQQCVQQLLAHMKIGCLECGKGGGKVRQTASRGTVQQTKGARDFQPPGSRGADTGAFINQHKIRAYLRCQRNCRPFPSVKKPEIGVLIGWRGHDGEP